MLYVCVMCVWFGVFSVFLCFGLLVFGVLVGGWLVLFCFAFVHAWCVCCFLLCWCACCCLFWFVVVGFVVFKGLWFV